MEGETTSYPPIEPSTFDLIVVGTGLPESVVAAAASAAGETVLHLDTNPFYGAHYASLPLNDFVTFLQSHSQPSEVPEAESDDSIPLVTRSLYSSLEISSHSDEPLKNSRRFNIDLAGPRVFLCSDSMIDVILKTGINQYMEFKSVDTSFVGDVDGKLMSVPDSRSAIFKDRSLSIIEKNRLMKFFKLVQAHFSEENEEDRIPEEDLESPFVEFLTKIGLSQKLKSIILYAIVNASYDQDNIKSCKDVINTKSGISRLALHHSSVGRFPNANGAMIYPIYGQGEVPQAFCRRAAVKGCIYVLRMPVVCVLKDKEYGTYKGVKLVSGQRLFSSRLILAPSFTPLVPSTAQASKSHDAGHTDAKEKVARGICITNNSIRPEVSNCLVFFPPKSLYPEQIALVRAFQLSNNVAVCPPGMFVTYLSAMTIDAVEGKKLLTAAINALFSIPFSGNDGSRGIDNSSENIEVKPTLLWSALYMQELNKFQGALDSISNMVMPDEHLDYNHLLDAIERFFQEIYPGKEFLATSSQSNEHPNYADSELDS
ncbi:rab protein geranylgeranyltransferase component A 1-like [Dorcoceras hygrometricum]|uniref:Rab escort protein 1 n=1 Tax=Dorcoceras hygrometricum TaxID=472368 RepID=A0A2Z7B2A3_9LAMI|nr:rab protein geranylgeranyltransferase component A 1-like [Dorcoceras hygrometricum]